MTGEIESNEAGVEVAALPAENAIPPIAEPNAAPGFIAKVFAPYRYMFWPRECGRVMASAPWHATLGYFLGIVFIGASVIVDVIVGQLVEHTWGFAGYEGGLVHRTPAEAFTSLGNPRMSATQFSLAAVGIVTVWVLVATLVFSWIILPIVHRSGSALRSFVLATRAAAGVVGLLTLLTLVIGIAMALIDNYRDVEIANRLATTSFVMLSEYMLIGMVAVVILAVAWLGRWTRQAAIGARPPGPLPIAPLACEACGYDLTHRSESGVCTECGTATNVSLDQGIRRTGVAWEREPMTATWVAANWDLLMRPRAFYLRLRMRTNEPRAFSFAFRNYLMFAVLSVISIASMVNVTQSSVSLDEMLAVLVFGGALSGVGAWLLHGLVGGLAAALTVSRQQSRPFAYISKVWQYESAYLWMLWIVGYVLAWSFALFDDWMTQLAEGLTGYRTVNVEELVVPILVVVMLFGWIMRFRRAITATQWANF